MTNIAVGIGIASRYSIHTSRLANTPVAGSVCNQFAAAALREQAGLIQSPSQASLPVLSA